MRPIQAGDLVVVTRAISCCGDKRTMGKIFRVAKVDEGFGTCGICGKNAITIDALDEVDDVYFPTFMLTRIDPLPADETQDNHESLTA